MKDRFLGREDRVLRPVPYYYKRALGTAQEIRLEIIFFLRLSAFDACTFEQYLNTFR